MFIKQSTKKFYQAGKTTANYSWHDWLHGYVYARWPYLYIGVGTGEHKLSKPLSALWQFLQKLFPSSETSNDTRQSFADGYHGKVVPLNQASQLVTVNKEIKIDDLEKIIPYQRARSIILKNPDHIAVMECPCRSARKNPCKPLDVCLIIGEPFVSFVLDHHPQKARKITQQEAVQIIKEEDARGHVHHAFFKDAMLQRFYAICNCCSCCCGAMQAMRNGTPMLAPSGYILQIEEEKCIGCANCVEFCQFKALRLHNGKIQVDETLCMGCGVCVDKCKQHAHHLVKDERKGQPLEIVKLMEQATSLH